MSRIGRAPISVPPKVQVSWSDGNLVSVKGPRGELSCQIDPALSLKLEDGTLNVSRPSDSKEHKAKHGLYRTLVNNMVIGVTNGYTKQLEIHGVGYRASKIGENLVVLVGYSHPVEVQPPQGISFTIEGVDPATKATKISVSGIDRNTYIVTQFVALGVIFLLAIVFYVWGHMEKRNQDVVVEVDLSDMSETELSVGAGE